jgi:hypothetical protein
MVRLDLFFAGVFVAMADLPVHVPLPGNKDGKGNDCVSWWCPMLLSTKINTTLLFGCCKLAAPSRSILSMMISSKDAGKTWSDPITPPDLGQAVYSSKSGTIIMTMDMSSRGAARQLARYHGQASHPDKDNCTAFFDGVCPGLYGKNQSCIDCIQKDWAAHGRGTCGSKTDAHVYCCPNHLPGDPAHIACRLPLPTPPPTPSTPPPAPVPPNPNCPDCKQPSQLHPLTPAQLALCRTGTIRSTDDGQTWSEPVEMKVSNSLGPAYAAGGLNHGIEIQVGPHAGRLAMARRFDCPAAMGDHGKPEYFHSFVLYSDDDGRSWAVGELLPEGWTECQIAEMHNGSLLMTSRMYGTQFIPDPTNMSDPKNRRRGFARSDDGGRSWSSVWYVADRQPEISRLQPTCAEAIVSDPSSDATIYWSHPGGECRLQVQQLTQVYTITNCCLTISAHLDPNHKM